MIAPRSPDRESQIVWLVLVILGVLLAVVGWFRWLT